MTASPRLRFRTVLFDLDGTLVESAPDIHASINIVLARDGLEPLTLDQVVSMIGHGLGKLVERAYAARGVDLDAAAFDAKLATTRDVYQDNLTVLTTLLPGARETILACRARGHATGLVTNKPQPFAETMVAELGLADVLDVVIGGDAGIAKKPAPDMLLEAARRCGSDAADTLMVGDGPADVQAARNAGMAVVVLKGGYTQVPADQLGADHVIERLTDLMGFLAEPTAA